MTVNPDDHDMHPSVHHVTDGVTDGVTDDRSRQRRPIQSEQWTLFTVLIVATLGSIAVWMMAGDRRQFLSTGIYFVLVPGLLAALVSIVPFARHQTGLGIVRGTTIGILATAIVIREGFVCVVIALPLILPVVALTAWAFGKSKPRGPRYMIPIMLLGLSSEGIAYQPPTIIDVSRSRLVDATPTEIDEVLRGPAALSSIEPVLFRLPFPSPTAVDGQAARIGDRLVVTFDSGGRLELELVERSYRRSVWVVVGDTTPLADWMALRRVEMVWTGQDADTEPADPEDAENADAATEVGIEIEFDRALAPALYFDPVERWGVGEMAEVLLDMLVHNLDSTDGGATDAGSD